MFRRPKKVITEIVEKPIEKCSFCKKNNSVGKLRTTYYCSSNSCATKLWDKQKKQDTFEFEKNKKINK